MLRTLRQALYLMGRDQRKRWVLVVALAVVVSLLEILAATLVYVLLGLIAGPDADISLPLVGTIDLGGGDRTLLLALIGIMIAFFLLRAGVSAVAEYVMARVVHNAASRLSTKLVTGYLLMPYAFHLRRNSAELIRNGHQAVIDLVYMVFTPLIRITAEALMTIGILVLLVLISPIGTALAVAVVGGATLILVWMVHGRLRKHGATAHEMSAETLKSLQQSYAGIRDIKLLGRELYFSADYGKHRSKLSRMLYTCLALSQMPRLVIETSLVAFILVFMAIALAMDSDSQSIVSTLGLFAYAGLRLQPSLARIVSGFNAIRFSTAPTADVYGDLRMIEGDSAHDVSGEPVVFEREIRLDSVSFTYDQADAPALEGVDLVIARGEQLGICGPTGGGKTTLVDLITGLLAPTTGAILVDGQDIAGRRRSWQRSLGTVPQTPFLLDDSLRRNIALGVPDADIKEADVIEAIRLAQLTDFVRSLSSGLDTVVGERGIRLSGGQRQRIAIARALYQRPQVLLFDEGTSALDSATEQEFMFALRGLRREHTILLVAHRLSTLRDSDRVVFISHGQIAAIDTFERLLRTNGAFRDMAAKP